MRYYYWRVSMARQEHNIIDFDCLLGHAGMLCWWLRRRKGWRWPYGGASGLTESARVSGCSLYNEGYT